MSTYAEGLQRTVRLRGPELKSNRLMTVNVCVLCRISSWRLKWRAWNENSGTGSSTWRRHGELQVKFCAEQRVHRSSILPQLRPAPAPSCPELRLTHPRGMDSDAKSWTFTLECRSYWDVKPWILYFLGCICFLVRCTLPWMGESLRAETANFLLERKGLVRRQQMLSVCKEYLSEMIRQSKKQKQNQELA